MKKPDVVIYDSRLLWHLAPNTRVRELDSGRDFTIGTAPGKLWHGNTPCTLAVLDMPVLVRG